MPEIRRSTKAPSFEQAQAQMFDNAIVENLGCMKGPQPLHFLSAGGGVHVAEEKIPEGPLARPRGNFHSAQIFCPCAAKRTRKFAIRRKRAFIFFGGIDFVDGQSFEQAQAGTFAYGTMALKHH